MLNNHSISRMHKKSRYEPPAFRKEIGEPLTSTKINSASQSPIRLSNNLDRKLTIRGNLKIRGSIEVNHNYKD
jgi:hypothetical protein